jgi:hypothetical protein
MSRAMRTLITASLLCFGVVLQVALLSHYSSGPEAILLVPTAALVYAGIAVAGGRLAGRRPVLVAISSAIAIAASVSFLHPTDGRMKPHTYLLRLGRALTRYSRVTYAHAYAEEERDRPLRTLAARKYRDRIPERAILIHYYASPDVSWSGQARIALEFRSGRWQVLDLSGGLLSAAVSDQTLRDQQRIAVQINGGLFGIMNVANPGAPPRYEALDRMHVSGKPLIDAFNWDF